MDIRVSYITNGKLYQKNYYYVENVVQHFPLYSFEGTYLTFKDVNNKTKKILNVCEVRVL